MGVVAVWAMGVQVRFQSKMEGPKAPEKMEVLMEKTNRLARNGSI